MKIHKNCAVEKPTASPCVLAIGNFDGVHLGHQALIKKAAALAREQNLSLGVLTFEPHPRLFFQPDSEPFRLTPPHIKQRWLKEAGVENLFIADFNAGLAAMTADEFMQRILQDHLQARHIVVGEDFAFGKGRGGNVEKLKTKFGVTALAPVTNAAGDIYSSTAIRAFLQKADFKSAAAMLGRPWEIEEAVIHGDKRGRELGYPTANQKVEGYIRIPYGIYAVEALIDGETIWRGGAANFGIRPMFQVEKPLLETYIFDFLGDIYGCRLRVRPVRLLRPEIKFDGLEALMQQMKQDCIQARAVLKSAKVL